MREQLSGRAKRCQRLGRGFNSLLPLQKQSHSPFLDTVWIQFGYSSDTERKKEQWQHFVSTEKNGNQLFGLLDVQYQQKVFKAKQKEVLKKLSVLKKVAEKPKIIKKIKAATSPVKIDWDLPPMHTAFLGASHLIPKIKESSPYKLLEHP